MGRAAAKNRINLTVFCIVLAVIIVIIAAVLLRLMTRSDEPAVEMRLIRREGQVTLLNASNKKLDILETMRLYDGSVIRTEEDGSIMVSMDYTKVASIAPGSRLAFHKIGQTDLALELSKGRLFFNVPRTLADGETFEIRTANMTVDIRGASGVVDADNGTVLCTDGVVTVTGYSSDTDGGSTVTLYPGQRAKIYMVSDQADGNGVVFACEDITPEELPVDVLGDIAPVEQLLDRIVTATGWDRGQMLALAGVEDSSVSEEIYVEEPETAPVPTAAPRPTAQPTPEPETEETPAPRAEALDAGSAETSGESAVEKPVITKPGATASAKPAATASPRPAATPAPAQPVRPMQPASPAAEPETEKTEPTAPEELDTTGPSLSLGETVAEDTPQANGYYRTKYITATATDDMSGVADIVMDEASYEEPGFEVTENGVYTVTAADRAGNTTAEEYEITGIDSTGPELEETDRELIVGEEQQIEAVRVSLTVTDDESGVTEDAEVTITGPNEQEYQPEESVYDEDTGSLTVRFTAQENGEYAVSASDALENVSTVTVSVDEITAPTADPIPAPAVEEAPAP